MAHLIKIHFKLRILMKNTIVDRTYFSYEEKNQRGESKVFKKIFFSLTTNSQVNKVDLRFQMESSKIT